MSKKIMKRSLALGALMAFVITGSAMAAELNLTGDTTVTAFPNDIDKITGTGTYTVNNTAAANQNNIIIENKQIEIEGVDLVLNSPTTGNWYSGIIKNSSIKSNGLVFLNQTGKDNALGYGTEDSITADVIKIHSEGTKAIYSDGYGAKHNLTAREIYITSKADDAIHTESNSAAINITATEKIEISSAEGYGVVNANGNVHIEAPTLIINSDDRAAVSVGQVVGSTSSTGTTTIKADSLTITADTRDHTPDKDRYSSAIFVQSGTLNLEVADKLVIEDNKQTDNTDSYGLSVHDGAELNLNISKDTTVQITGDIKTEQNSTLTGMELSGEDSYIKGTINTGDSTNAAISFSDNATWENNGTSNVKELTLDGGIIEQSQNNESNANKITIGELKGEGTLNVDSTTEDQLVIKQKENGSKLTVSTTNQDISLEELVNVASMENASSDGETTSAADTVKKTGGSVYSEESATVNKETGGIENLQQTVDSANLNANDMVAVGLMSWRAETNDMNKRMGELRNANGEHGVWVRMVRGEQEYKNVKNQYNQYQLGYDEKLSVDKRWTVGAALSYTDAENSFSNGNGESENKALAVYGSKLNDDGSFVDLIAKYGRIENDFKLYSGMEDADYSTNAYSLSAEFGKRIQQGKGLWIEPQVELTYGKVSAVDYVSSRGVKVAQDSMESIIGRVGFSLGKDIKQGNVYARASYLYDFDGETSATMDGTAKMEQDLGGGWWEVGVGANINLSKSTYIYADVEKTFGGEVDTNWQWNLGVRYSF